MAQGQTWNGDVLHDAGNVVSDIGGWLSGPPGDPGRIRACADQVDALVTRFHADHRGLNEGIDELTTAWTGDGATQFRATWYGGGTQVATDRVLTDARAKLSRFSRNLRDYADQLEHAQTEHWIQMGILVALTVVNAAQLGADPATNAAEVGVAAGTAVGTSFALADIGTMAVQSALIGFGTDVVSQFGADLIDRLDPRFDATGDHSVALFNPGEAVLSGVTAAGSGVLFAAGGRAFSALLSRGSKPPAIDFSSPGARLAWNDGFDTQAGRGYYPSSDADMRATATALKPFQGEYTVDVHGDPNNVYVGTVQLDADQVSELIRADANWNNQPVRLFSCNTGEGVDPIAQQVADRLGVSVTAPVERAWSGMSGDSFVAPAKTEWQVINGRFQEVEVPGTPIPDGWRTFTPPPHAPAPQLEAGGG